MRTIEVSCTAEGFTILLFKNEVGRICGIVRTRTLRNPDADWQVFLGHMASFLENGHIPVSMQV